MMLMFFIENMTAKEAKKQIGERLNPIKLFCKRWHVGVRYEKQEIIAEEVTAQIQELIELLDLQEDDKLKLRAKKFRQFQFDFNLFLTSINKLKTLDRALLYHGLFKDATQVELTETDVILDLLEVESISQPKISSLYQEACFELLNWIIYNEAKAVKYAT